MVEITEEGAGKIKISEGIPLTIGKWQLAAEKMARMELVRGRKRGAAEDFRGNGIRHDNTEDVQSGLNKSSVAHHLWGAFFSLW